MSEDLQEQIGNWMVTQTDDQDMNPHTYYDCVLDPTRLEDWSEVDALLTIATSAEGDDEARSWSPHKGIGRVSACAAKASELVDLLVNLASDVVAVVWLATNSYLNEHWYPLQPVLIAAKLGVPCTVHSLGPQNDSTNPLSCSARPVCRSLS
ncbi:hypothetical protein ABZ891_38485 [Streptomyces sp. NPDC047023]|uniref:hypothetical protein n=1 Tax=Streptomyces sp. NPDC047023 TaxID=3155139 RepID=UPI0033EE001A